MGNDDAEASPQANQPGERFDAHTSENGGVRGFVEQGSTDPTPGLNPIPPLHPDFDEFAPGRATSPVGSVLSEIEAHARHARDELHEQLIEQRARIQAKNEEINKRSGRNLIVAILIGLLLGAIFIVSLVFVEELFVLLATVIVSFVVFELTTALRGAGRDVPRIPSVAAAAIALPLTFMFGSIAQWLGLIAAILFVSLWRLATASFARPAPKRSDVWRDFVAGAFVQLYVTLLASFIVLLTAQEGGQYWTLAFVVIVVAIDTSAYAFGLNFGKHKMAPRISPGKTWEGLAGAAAAGVIASILLSVFLLGQPWWFGFIMGPLLLLTATTGDLTESMIKRSLGIKDMSSWLPGHGGFFDRVDSILPSGAMMFALYFWSAHMQA